MHLKITEASKRWPIPRRGRTFVVVPSHDKASGIPLLLVLRDMLGIAHTRREARLILRAGKVLVNGNIVKDDTFSLGLFDIISLDHHTYRVVLQEGGKFALDSGGERIAKIVGKTLLSQKRIQLHLHNGNNFLVKEDYHVGDSVVIANAKIEKTIPLKIGANIIVMGGKSAGTKGIVERIEGAFAAISSQKGKHIIPLKNIMALQHGK